MMTLIDLLSSPLSLIIYSCDPSSFTTDLACALQVGKKEEEERKQGTAGGESDALLGEQKHHGGEQDSEAESCAPHTGERNLALPPWPSSTA